MMKGPLDTIARKIEALLIEYHKTYQESMDYDSGLPDDYLITGVDFIVSYEVKVIDDSSSGGLSYCFSGNQSGTTTLGLVARAQAWSESTFLYPEEND